MSSPGSPRAICLHGFPDGPETFGPLCAALEAAGVRTFAPHLPGHRGEDAQAFLRATTELGAIPAALLALVEVCEPFIAEPGPVHLIGHDWGAVLGYALVSRSLRFDSHHLDSRISRFSRRLSTFTALAIPPLVAPVHAALRHPYALTRFDYLAAFQLPYVPERLLASPAFLAALTRRWSPGFTLPREVTESVTRRYRDPAVRSAVLAYYRALAPRPTRPREVLTTWRLLSSPPTVPTLVIRGDRDGCFVPEVFPRAVARAAALAASQATVELVTVASGHFPQLEATDSVMERWVSRWSPGVPCEVSPVS